MKKIKTFAVAATMLLLLSCANNNSENTTATTETETQEGKPAAASETNGGDGLAGEWEIQGVVQDTNDNLQIDEEERANLKAASFKDYMKLNPDGTGLFTVAKMEGRYEVKDENGKKFMRWYDQANGAHRVGTILKTTKEELHIKEPGGNGMFVWKRI
jgi:phosphopentomutase